MTFCRLYRVEILQLPANSLFEKFETAKTRLKVSRPFKFSRLHVYDTLDGSTGWQGTWPTDQSTQYDYRIQFVFWRMKSSEYT